MKDKLFLKHTFISILFLLNFSSFGQTTIFGKTFLNNTELAAVAIWIDGTEIGTISDQDGFFTIFIQEDDVTLKTSFIGANTFTKKLNLAGIDSLELNINLSEESSLLSETVVSGNLKEVERLQSIVPVELYTKEFFRKTPSTNLFESVANINGVRPQINCNVCNTGDIHINGLEGPYTMVLIDGMPVMGGLASVYGLMGIPNSMINKLEVIKGPASSLYGSEAVGGLMNVITKDATDKFSIGLDISTTSFQEQNIDFGMNNKISEKLSVLTGLNLFHYDNPIDNNGDNFTDLSIQKRFSIFQKWSIGEKDNKWKIGLRYFNENRWGGEMNWTPQFEGGDSIYGESIRTERFEVSSSYIFPSIKELELWFNYSSHQQESYYGNTPYSADQKIGFTQLNYRWQSKSHSFLGGLAMRYNYYDDNTPATFSSDESLIPGLFVQDEYEINKAQMLLVGARVDFHEDHGPIFTPRMAYKLTLPSNQMIRINAGTGFRVVNIFTEEHAALTGARDVIVADDIDPETSVNFNINYTKQFFFQNGISLFLESSGWYTYFNNQIIPDYDTDPQKIIYDNLSGYSRSMGFSLNAEVNYTRAWSSSIGLTLMDVQNFEEDENAVLIGSRPILSERFSAVASLTYRLKSKWIFDYTSNFIGPMRLPLLSDLDPRDEYSPFFGVHNVLATYEINSKLQIYGGVKNIFNYKPASNSIARSQDPFDKEVQFDNNGNAVPSANNSYGLTFDPSYAYYSMQGVRAIFGLKLYF